MKRISLVILLALLPLTVWSACKQKDLAGTWWLQVPDNDDFDTISAVCPVKLRKNGRLQKSGGCTFTSASVRVEFIRGQVTLGKDCVGKGTIVARGTAPNGARVEENFTVRKLILNRSKDVAVVLINDAGAPQLDDAVTMVKQ